MKNGVAKKALCFVYLVLLVSLAVGCDGGGIVPPPSSEAEKFIGTWVNVDENTEHITKIRISETGNNLLVEEWGKCYPDDCYWEPKLIKKSEIIDGMLEVFWEGSTKQVFQEIKLLDDPSIRVTTRYEYANGWQWSAIDYFVK
jgi:hypothetical protein